MLLFSIHMLYATMPQSHWVIPVPRHTRHLDCDSLQRDNPYVIAPHTDNHMKYSDIRESNYHIIATTLWVILALPTRTKTYTYWRTPSDLSHWSGPRDRCDAACRGCPRMFLRRAGHGQDAGGQSLEVTMHRCPRCKYSAVQCRVE